MQGWVDATLESLASGTRRMEVASGTLTSDDGLREQGHRCSFDVSQVGPIASLTTSTTTYTSTAIAFGHSSTHRDHGDPCTPPTARGLRTPAPKRAGGDAAANATSRPSDPDDTTAKTAQRTNGTDTAATYVPLEPARRAGEMAEH